MIICPEKTAISTGVANSAKIISKLLSPPKSILDYGSGKLRNSNYLVAMGFRVSVLDTALQVSKYDPVQKTAFDGVFNSSEPTPVQRFSGVLCSFVLNVIPLFDDRVKLLTNVYELLDDEGVFVCEVRRGKGIFSNKAITPYLDGYIVGANSVRTFQKPYTIDELKKEISSVPFIIQEAQTLSDSVIVIAKKRNGLSTSDRNLEGEKEVCVQDLGK